MVDEEEPFQDQEDASRAEESYEPSSEEEQLLPHKAIEATGKNQVGSNETEKAMAGGQTCRGFTASFLKGATALLCLGALAGAMALLVHSRSSPAFRNGKNGLNEEETRQAENSLAGSFKDKNVQGGQRKSWIANLFSQDSLIGVTDKGHSLFRESTNKHWPLARTLG